MENKIQEEIPLALTDGARVIGEWKRRKAISETEARAFADTEEYQEILKQLRQKKADREQGNCSV